MASSKLTKAQQDALSFDALFVAGSLFMMMEPGKGTLTFRMVESRPSPRTQAALDELVLAGLVSTEPFNKYGGIVYTPLVSFPRPTAAQEKTAGKWPVTVPITAGDPS